MVPVEFACSFVVVDRSGVTGALQGLVACFNDLKYATPSSISSAIVSPSGRLVSLCSSSVSASPPKRGTGFAENSVVSIGRNDFGD
jgi:hypothetical protein